MMKRCPKCFGSIRRMGHIEKPFYCPECKEWFLNEEVTSKPTNADHIRGMSDEELAKWIFDLLWSYDAERRTKDWLDWLRQEVTDKDDVE